MQQHPAIVPWPAVHLPAVCAASRHAFADAVRDDIPHEPFKTNSAVAAHIAQLTALPACAWEQLNDAYICSYEVDSVYATAMLTPDVLKQLLTSAPAACSVFQVACTQKVRVLGIAPAHQRRGKWTHVIASDPRRIYVGPERLPVRAATVFSPQRQPHLKENK